MRARPAREPAAERPVARLAIDVSLPHLDRSFDYLVTEAQSEAAVAGVRCRVRFAGQLVDAIVLDRVDASEHEGRLSFVERVLGSEPVLTPEIAALAREVAGRWAGSLADVVRLAVPPRHAAAEKLVRRPPQDPPPPPDLDALDRYDGGAAVLSELATGTPRRSWTMLPGPWPDELATAVRAAAAAGRGVVTVVPDARDVARLDAAFNTALGPGRHVALTADLGPAERYRRFLAVSRGEVRVVVGTRAAIWAPVHDLGLLVVWDDGDDLLAEPRAPYPNVRDIAILRAHRANAGLLLAGHAMTAEVAQLVESQWAGTLEPSQAARRRDLPQVRATGDDDALADDAAARAARLPTLAWRAAREGLEAGPVLIQVPRRGYQPGLACAACRNPAHCRHCGGPLARPAADRPPVCRWCGVVATDWRCATCGKPDLRAVIVGVRRTAEEFGRAFAGVPVRTSGGGAVLDQVDDRPALVLSTPGAEPVATGGYAAAVLLDGWMLLSRPDLRAGEEALRRWLAAAALVRGGGKVVVVAPGELRPVQALLRWQPRWHAERELDERRTLHLPPAGRMAALTGSRRAVDDLIAALDLPPGAEVLGPVPALARPAGAEDGEASERMLIRVPRSQGAELAIAVKIALAGRSARKAPGAVRVELDPAVLG
ncbi:MAG: primosomal protein N' [Frankiaceae bacterium]|nr:primosomal protein N' [Frankiaceae bacterium]